MMFPSCTQRTLSQPMGDNQLLPVEPLETTTQLAHGTPKWTTIRGLPLRITIISNLSRCKSCVALRQSDKSHECRWLQEIQRVRLEGLTPPQSKIGSPIIDINGCHP